MDPCTILPAGSPGRPGISYYTLHIVSHGFMQPDFLSDSTCKYLIPSIANNRRKVNAHAASVVLYSAVPLHSSSVSSPIAWNIIESAASSVR